MARLTRPFTFAASGLGIFGILCAILLLTAGTNTATSNIQLLSVDTTTLGTQVHAWLRQHLGTLGVQPENVLLDFVPGALRRVYYMGDVAGTLAGNTSLTYDVLGQLLPPKVYEHNVFGSEWFAISVSNGTGSAIIDKRMLNVIEGLSEEIFYGFFSDWNRSVSATINPQPVAGMLIAGTVLQASAVTALLAISLGAVALVGKRGLALAGLAAVAAILSLASAAWITNVLRSEGTEYEIGQQIIAVVPYSTSAAFWVLTCLNAACGVLVAGLTAGLAWVGIRSHSRTHKTAEKEVPDEA